MTGQMSRTGSDLAIACAALRESAAYLDLSERTRGLFHGPRAVEVLNGLLTNDLASLHPGEGAYAAALTPKGKVLADVRVFLREADVLVDAPAAAAPGWWAMIRKYVNPRLARYEDVSLTLGDVSLFGERAAQALARVTDVDARSLRPFANRQVSVAGVPATLACVPDAGVPGFTLFVPRESVERVCALLAEAGAVPGLRAALEVARVEAGRPAWGVDMDDTTLVQEARLDELGAVSHTKGCYTGQETVARVHFRGHVNRTLRGLYWSAAVTIPRGTALTREDGSVVGDVRSSVVSPRLGAISLAMLRREVTTGTTLTAEGGEGQRVTAVVSDLPFPS
jgi:folate-binding protein YgfZ